jgi:hypothetical protein
MKKIILYLLLVFSTIAYTQGHRRALLMNGNTATVDNRFIITVKSDNAGTSGANQFTIPTTSGGYLYDIETSDGYTATGITGNHTITFPSGAGTYDVFISGDFPIIYFNNGGDKLKLLEVKNWGFYGNASVNYQNQFYGCLNLVITDSNPTNYTSLVGLINAYRDCQSVTSLKLNVTPLNPIVGYSLSSAFRGMTSLIAFPNIDTEFANSFFAVCLGNTSMTSLTLLNTTKSTSFRFAFSGCTSLADVPANLFNGTPATNFESAFTNTNLTQTSIDNILVSIESNGTSSGTFTQSGGSAPSTTGETAIDALRARGWTITVTGGY